MSRFVKSFYELGIHKLVEEINKYTTENDLEIISLSASDDLHGAIVLFEGEKPKYVW